MSEVSRVSFLRIEITHCRTPSVWVLRKTCVAGFISAVPLPYVYLYCTFQHTSTHKIEDTCSVEIGIEMKDWHILHSWCRDKCYALQRKGIPNQPCTLGLPWLTNYNPCISWSEREITTWSLLWHASYFKQPTITIASASLKSLDTEHSLKHPLAFLCSTWCL